MDLTSGVSGSSTEEKARVLPALFANVEVGGVVAVGTAAWPHADENRSGSVVVGSSVFVHDSYANQPNQNSRWTDRRCEALVTSRSALFDVLDTAILSEIESRMIPAPLTSWSAKHGVQVDAGLVAVGNVNITDYTEYATRDPLAVRAALNAGLGTRLASLETTHGLIRMQSDAPFIFVSGIVNTVGCFAEMRKFDKAQNFVGAHNAGLLIAWLFGGLTSC